MMRRFSLQVVGHWAIAALVISLGSGLASAQQRVALVIGNSAYKTAPQLANPASDAKAIAGALSATGFTVITALDVDKAQLSARLEAFEKSLATAETGLFFFAGHGFQSDGRNYILPVDARLTDAASLEADTVAVDAVIQIMERDRPGRINIVILDACRNNPLVETFVRNVNPRALARISAMPRSGLAEVRASANSLIAFATSPGNVADDGAAGNSPFTASLVRQIAKEHRSLGSILNNVRKDVMAATGGAQVPWDHSSLLADFYFWRYGVAAPPEQQRGRVNAFTWRTVPSEVEPGLRQWAREADGSWSETYPSGHVQRMDVRARVLLDGCAGTVVGPPNEPAFAVFIPDKGCRAMVARWQRGIGTHWNVLGAMQNVR